MYLTHASLIMVFIKPKISFLQSGQQAIIATRFVLYWLLSYIVSIVMYKFVEEPFMAMRHKK
jgi:peptidoglycan/LPS O-acetylase OafA/YrhL